jgi:hypothetical protein
MTRVWVLILSGDSSSSAPISGSVSDPRSSRSTAISRSVSQMSISMVRSNGCSRLQWSRNSHTAESVNTGSVGVPRSARAVTRSSEAAETHRGYTDARSAQNRQEALRSQCQASHSSAQRPGGEPGSLVAV